MSESGDTWLLSDGPSRDGWFCLVCCSLAFALFPRIIPPADVKGTEGGSEVFF